MKKSELLELKENIEDTKNDISRLEGRRDHYIQELADDWGCESLSEAKTKLAKMKKDIKKLQDKIEKKVEKITEHYNI